MLEQYIDDEYITDYFDKIHKYEEIHLSPAHHGKAHAINVSEMMQKIILLTNSDNELIEEAKLAGLLHDLGCYLGKDDHEIRSYEIAKEFIGLRKIHLKNYDLVLEAIKKHRNDFYSTNPILRALVLADKLDITNDRVTDSGLKIIGMRQLQYITKVEFSLQNNVLVIKFVANNSINLDELLNFYFMKKVISSIQSYAKWIQKNYQIFINDILVEEGKMDIDLEEKYWKKQINIYENLQYESSKKYMAWQPARWSSNAATVSEIFKIIDPIETVCELGAGSAAFSLEMYRQNNNLKLYAIDKSPVACQYAKKIASDMNIPINYYCGDFFKNFNEKKYDIVLSLGVIEHYNEVERKKFVQKCIDISNKYIFIAIPNQNSNIFQSYILWSNKNNNNYEEEHEKFDINDLQALVSEMDLTPIKLGGFQVYLSESDFLTNTIKENKEYINKLKDALIKQNEIIGRKFPNYNFKANDIESMKNAELSFSDEERTDMSFMSYVLCKKK